MDRAQQAVLETVREDGRLITWPDETALGELVPPLIRVEGSPPVMVVPRLNPDPEAPIVLHLLNRAYDAEHDTWIAQKNIRLDLHPELFPDRQFRAATWLTPDGSSCNVDIDDRVVTIPECGLWGLLVLEEGRP